MTDKSNRRSFLKKSLLAGTSAAMLPLVSVAEKKEKQASSEGVNVNSTNNNTVTILVTADIHAQLHTHDEFFWEDGKAVYKKRGGLAHLKTMIEHYRKQDPKNTILYDGGDFFHGHGVASLTEGEALIPIFNKMGYDLILPGNWEVVYKKKKMLYDMGHSNAAKICANMFHQSETMPGCELVYPPYWIKYINGVKIGFIGYTDHLIPKRQSPAYSEGLTFEHADKSVKKYVQMLRENEGCAVVILATHMGLAQQVGLANNPVCEGVDLIIGADTHERVREPIQAKYSKVVECGAFGSFLGKIDLKFEKGKLINIGYDLLDVDPAQYTADPELQKMVNEAAEPFRELKKVIGISTTP
ncbi:MAG: metallophosphoesterase, partial [Bacteroidota bacterium]